MIEVFIDGASRGQGSGQMGEAACAVVIFDRKKPVVQFARGLGRRTNNEAEYEALITALLMCSMSELRDPIIYCDSSVVVNQVNGRWECRSPRLLPLFLSVNAIKRDYRFRLHQVKRDRVALADALGNRFLDTLEKTREESDGRK